MTFWQEVLAGFFGNIFAGFLLVILYVIIQWFLHATDVKIGYNWGFKGSAFHPQFDIRNRSASKTYFVASIVYTTGKGKIGKGKTLVGIDNKSLWGKELKPGTINHFDAGPVKGIHSLADCIEVEVSVRLQTGRIFWLKGQGPGQEYVNRIQRIAFGLRETSEKLAIPGE